MKLVSLQRGMGFPILEGTYQGQYDWITHLFRYGGANLMLRSVREVLHVDGEHYVRVNFHTFEQLIQSVVTNAKGMNLLEINSMLDTVLPLVQTNLTTTDILGLIGYAPAVLGMEMEEMTIPSSGTYGSMTGLGGRTLYAVDFQTNSELLHEFLYGSE